MATEAVYGLSLCRAIFDQFADLNRLNHNILEGAVDWNQLFPHALIAVSGVGNHDDSVSFVISNLMKSRHANSLGWATLLSMRSSVLPRCLGQLLGKDVSSSSVKRATVQGEVVNIRRGILEDTLNLSGCDKLQFSPRADGYFEESYDPELKGRFLGSSSLEEVVELVTRCMYRLMKRAMKEEPGLDPREGGDKFRALLMECMVELVGAPVAGIDMVQVPEFEYHLNVALKDSTAVSLALKLVKLHRHVHLPDFPGADTLLQSAVAALKEEGQLRVETALDLAAGVRLAHSIVAQALRWEIKNYPFAACDALGHMVTGDVSLAASGLEEGVDPRMPPRSVVLGEVPVRVSIGDTDERWGCLLLRQYLLKMEPWARRLVHVLLASMIGQRRVESAEDYPRVTDDEVVSWTWLAVFHLLERGLLQPETAKAPSTPDGGKMGHVRNSPFLLCPELEEAICQKAPTEVQSAFDASPLYRLAGRPLVEAVAFDEPEQARGEDARTLSEFWRLCWFFTMEFCGPLQVVGADYGRVRKDALMDLLTAWAVGAKVPLMPEPVFDAELRCNLEVVLEQELQAAYSSKRVRQQPPFLHRSAENPMLQLLDREKRDNLVKIGVLATGEASSPVLKHYWAAGVIEELLAVQEDRAKLEVNARSVPPVIDCSTPEGQSAVGFLRCRLKLQHGLNMARLRVLPVEDTLKALERNLVVATLGLLLAEHQRFQLARVLPDVRDTRLSILIAAVLRKLSDGAAAARDVVCVPLQLSGIIRGLLPEEGHEQLRDFLQTGVLDTAGAAVPGSLGGEEIGEEMDC